MRFLFALRHPAYVRTFESTLRLLDERGHEVVLAMGMWGRQREEPTGRRLTELEAELSGLSIEKGVDDAGAQPESSRRTAALSRRPVLTKR